MTNIYIVKGNKSKSTKRKSIWSKIWRKQAQDFSSHAFTSPNNELWHVWSIVYHGRLLETQKSHVLLGTGYVGTYLALPKFQTSRRKQMFGINHMVCTNSLGTVLEWWEPSWNSNSKMLAKGQLCKQIFLRITASSLLCWLFSAQYAINVNNL